LIIFFIVLFEYSKRYRHFLEPGLDTLDR